MTNLASTALQSPAEAELAAVIVEALNLEIAPQDIAPEAPLYKEGLGLDSIDILEIALVASKRYGVQIKADDAENVRIFASLRALSDHILRHRPAPGEGHRPA
ncbi:MAG: acyl carrier protein [Burkholderiales bacterium]|nr:acyl carrier protein [Burkholderiales bacterium]